MDSVASQSAAWWITSKGREMWDIMYPLEHEDLSQPCKHQWRYQNALGDNSTDIWLFY
jgi:hypothetical protein